MPVSAVDQRCIVCGDYGVVALGVRARYSNTNAVWAPNIGAHLCAEHATSGCEIQMTLVPTKDGRVTTSITGPRGTFETALVIGTGVKVPPRQGSLL